MCFIYCFDDCGEECKSCIRRITNNESLDPKVAVELIKKILRNGQKFDYNHKPKLRIHFFGGEPTLKFETTHNGYSVTSPIELKTNRSIKLFFKNEKKNIFLYSVTDAGMKKLKKQYKCIYQSIENY